MRCLVLYFYGDMFEVTASTWSHDLTAAGVDVQRLRTDELKADGRAGPITDVATDPINEVLSKILLSLQRVVLVLAPTEVVRSLALAADAKGMVSAGWAWISDALCARVDVRGDTAQAGFPIAADHGLARPFILVASFGGSIRRSAHALCGFACSAASCAAHRPLPVRPCLHAYLPTCSHPHTLAQCALPFTRNCLQAIATRNALHGWLYVSASMPEDLRIRDFAQDVRAATEQKLTIKLGDSAVDPAAMRLYDAIYLWAHAYTQVLSRQGT